MGEHINKDGEFQSDKYPTCPAGKVPLSTKDPMAQDLLWEYAQRRRKVDAEFAADLEAALRSKGYPPPDPEDRWALLLANDRDREVAERAKTDVVALLEMPAVIDRGQIVRIDDTLVCAGTDDGDWTLEPSLFALLEREGLRMAAGAEAVEPDPDYVASLKRKMREASQKLAMMLYLYRGHLVVNRGPLGLIYDALDQIAPDVRSAFSSCGSFVEFNDVYQRLFPEQDDDE